MTIIGLQNHSVSPCSRATEVDRIARLLFKNVSADSQSEMIFVTDEGSFEFESDPAAIAEYESRRLLKFPRNCKTQIKTVKSKHVCMTKANIVRSWPEYTN